MARLRARCRPGEMLVVEVTLLDDVELDDLEVRTEIEIPKQDLRVVAMRHRIAIGAGLEERLIGGIAEIDHRQDRVASAQGTSRGLLEVRMGCHPHEL